MGRISETTNWIPAIPREQISALAERIKPVVRDERNVLSYIKHVDLFSASFLWKPEPLEAAADLTEIGRITTYHTFGYPALFKPSVAEVLAQIPEAYLGAAVAFEIIGPNDADDLNIENAALTAGYHVATTVLYGR
jgi:hypothetical protein